MDPKVGEVEVQGVDKVYEVQAEVCEEQVHGEVGEMGGEGGGMEADGCEEDQVGEMDGQVEGMEAEEGEVEVGDASSLNRDNVEGPGLVDMDLNVASDVEVE
ncbi:hypothetical protein DEO72_LG8g1551 [Vigna unguiculata]|uniref:Uncharacterized protein n=1 Tax=Vigna unguiculata TaxID=3917 RepID=A0A4D6MPX7_VIGUN|nr:hypothetical protein DEO72_LG8g1551 [Vigna unguiculata]